jgi:hypothetical protein
MELGIISLCDLTAGPHTGLDVFVLGEHPGHRDWSQRLMDELPPTEWIGG